MLVTCGPLWDGQAPPPGGWCGRVYDDAQRWTICPHPVLGAADARERMEAHERGVDHQDT